MKKPTAPKAAGGAAAPAQAAAVHTSAHDPARGVGFATASREATATDLAQMQVTAVIGPGDLERMGQASVKRIPHAPDQYHGLGGTYIRDPITGIRRPAGEPEAGPAESLQSN